MTNTIYGPTKLDYTKEPIKTVGLKNDFIDNKLRWDLLPLKEVEEIVKILTYGANKYAPNNWQYLENGVDRYLAALLRHIVAWRNGEELDPESGLRHLSHAACNLIFLLYLTNKENENR